MLVAHQMKNLTIQICRLRFLLKYIIDFHHNKALWYWFVLKIKVNLILKKIRILPHYRLNHRFIVMFKKTTSRNIKIDSLNVIQNWTTIKSTSWMIYRNQTRKIFAFATMISFYFKTTLFADLNMFHSKLTNRSNLSFKMFYLLK